MKVLFIFLLLMVVNAVGTFAYGARVAGVRSQSISSSNALYNILTLFSRTANMIMLPLIGSVVEEAIRHQELHILTKQFQIMFLGMTIGTGISILFIPFMADLFEALIRKLQIHRSIPKMIISELNLNNLKKTAKLFRIGFIFPIKKLNFVNLPKGFLILNPIIQGIYSVGFLAALYAGALMPDHRLVASQLSSAINGFATISLFILVDPVMSVITDDVLKNKRPIEDLKRTVALLSIGRFTGTLLAQLFFIPTAYFIVWVSHWFI